jgi:hypothetical protein
MTRTREEKVMMMTHLYRTKSKKENKEFVRITKKQKRKKWENYQKKQNNGID